MKNIPFSVYLLASLLGFLGVGAALGGAMLILSPSGKMLGIPLAVLNPTPFTDYIIPGILLFTFIGLFPLLLIRPIIRRSQSHFLEKLNCLPDMQWMWTFSLYSAFAVILWIQIEMQMIQGVHWLHIFYVVLGLLIIVSALLPSTRKYFRIKKPIN